MCVKDAALNASCEVHCSFRHVLNFQILSSDLIPYARSKFLYISVLFYRVNF